MDTHTLTCSFLCVLECPAALLGRYILHKLGATIHLLLLLSCFSHVWLCKPRDGSPPGSHIPGILQARTLEQVAISFSNAWKWKVKVKSLSRVQLLVTPWAAAYQAPLHGICQVRVLEWGAIAFSIRRQTRDWPPLRQRAKMIMLMTEDKSPRTEQVNLPGVNPEVWA